MYPVDNGVVIQVHSSKHFISFYLFTPKSDAEFETQKQKTIVRFVSSKVVFHVWETNVFECSAELRCSITLNIQNNCIHITKLHTQDKKCSLTKAYDDSCYLHQFCHPPDVVGDIVRHVIWGPLSRPLSAFTLFLMSNTGAWAGGKMYLAPSLLRLGIRDLIHMASFTSLSNHLDSAVMISVLSNVMEGWSWLTWICFVTSEVVKLDLRCSSNLGFRDLSISPTYIASCFKIRN